MEERVIKDREESNSVGNPRGIPYNALYGEKSPQRCTFFRLQVYKRVRGWNTGWGSPYKTLLSISPSPRL